VHPTLGILARFQAFFYALAFFQSDGVPPPAPARVTQTVGQPRAKPSSSLIRKVSSAVEFGNSSPFFQAVFRFSKGQFLVIGFRLLQFLGLAF